MLLMRLGLAGLSFLRINAAGGDVSVPKCISDAEVKLFNKVRTFRQGRAVSMSHRCHYILVLRSLIELQHRAISFDFSLIQ